MVTEAPKRLLRAEASVPISRHRLGKLELAFRAPKGGTLRTLHSVLLHTTDTLDVWPRRVARTRAIALCRMPSFISNISSEPPLPRRAWLASRPSSIRAFGRRREN